ncbi:unnamed protein product [Trichogramma brassicae]|uniref:Nose resistant-to-fluoxetine protein N-terminal domain-containing protein n=1 Tax=Trichogramma brassicae TaxID=86971 RepID=A0A6H5IEH1_9HYME|nr:unnamed protein product [Trichogramma brassicae]
MSRVLLTAWLLLLCATSSVIGYLTSDRRNYQQILLSDHVEERIHLLSPSNLLANRKCDGSDTLNNSCSRDLDFLKRDLTKRKEWALKMMDSSSKPQSGFLNGFLINIGSYDQCVSIHENLSGTAIRGRHCMYSVNPTTLKKPFPYNPIISICLPASCNSEDVAELVNATSDQIELLKIVELEWVFCSPLDSEKSDDSVRFIILFLIALYVFFLGVCTVCHMYRKLLFSPETINSKSFQSMCNLSFAKNNIIIFNTKTDESHLSIINGIRVISTAWIVLSHEYIFDLFQVNINLLDLLKFIQSWKSLYLFMGPFAVDTFFVLSGFLMTYMFLKGIEKQKFFNIPMYYLHRFFRLTPAVVALLAISIVFIPKFTSSARWDSLIGLIVGNCRKNWWPTIIYVQNFVNVNDMCLPHLWYLAVDMQLFWISPIILYPLYKKPKIGLLILSGFIVASIITPAVIVSVNDYHPLSLGKEKNDEETDEIFGEDTEIGEQSDKDSDEENNNESNDDVNEKNCEENDEDDNLKNGEDDDDENVSERDEEDEESNEEEKINEDKNKEDDEEEDEENEEENENEDEEENEESEEENEEEDEDNEVSEEANKEDNEEEDEENEVSEEANKDDNEEEDEEEIEESEEENKQETEKENEVSDEEIEEVNEVDEDDEVIEEVNNEENEEEDEENEVSEEVNKEENEEEDEENEVSEKVKKEENEEENEVSEEVNKEENEEEDEENEVSEKVKEEENEEENEEEDDNYQSNKNTSNEDDIDDEEDDVDDEDNYVKENNKKTDSGDDNNEDDEHEKSQDENESSKIDKYDEISVEERLEEDKEDEEVENINQTEDKMSRVKNDSSSSKNHNSIKNVTTENFDEKPGSYSTRMIMSFSLRRTLKDLFGYKPPSPHEIGCIHGIRTLATIALFVAHKLIPLSRIPYVNRSSLTEVQLNNFGIKNYVITSFF